MTLEQADRVDATPRRAAYPKLAGAPLPLWAFALGSLCSLGFAALAANPGQRDLAPRQHQALRTPERAAERFLELLRDADAEALGALWTGRAPPSTPDWLTRAWGPLELEIQEAHRMANGDLRLVGSVQTGGAEHSVGLRLRERHGQGFGVVALEFPDPEVP